jgi:hypothetical protein
MSNSFNQKQEWTLDTCFQRRQQVTTASVRVSMEILPQKRNLMFIRNAE